MMCIHDVSIPIVSLQDQHKGLLALPVPHPWSKSGLLPLATPQDKKMMCYHVCHEEAAE